ncbi:hypothetical protein QCD70_04170 [Agreia sp. PsM10]|uniref:hypothetical protein n=1 Tax=Agreia sp. PsM10 TaxID=3030533 RepID=UPI00263A6B08|nr:hypothetical protein [Agreia sp. PsM10]MDN4639432.1 hypothetical protein [Agreia sp. PsM10]
MDRQQQSRRLVRAPSLLTVAFGLVLTIAGCATQSVGRVSDFIEAARDGDTAEIRHLTTKDLPQEDLAVVIAYALEGCSWKTSEATMDKVQGVFECSSETQLDDMRVSFSMSGNRISAIARLSKVDH